jgi:osmotically-inducible protein OsmY
MMVRAESEAHQQVIKDLASAESIAKSIAGGQVVSNQIGMIPPAAGSEAETVNSDLDKSIENNLDAALIQRRFNKGVKFDVKNGFVTLTGEISSQSRRAQVEKVASAVPDLQHVVNEPQVKDQKATSSHRDCHPVTSTGEFYLADLAGRV